MGRLTKTFVLCIEIVGRTGKLEFLVTNRNEIWRVEENGDRHRYFTNATAIADVDYHFRKNILFWIDSGKEEIHWQPLDVKSILPGRNFKQPRNWEPVSLAIDFIGDKIYVVDILGVKIDVFELSGAYHSIVLGVNLIRPLDIKLDPYERYMFILDGFRIVRINIDGTWGISIIAQGIRSIHGLFIDLADKRMYWSRNRDSEVVSSNYFGGNITSLGKSRSAHTWGKFAVFKGRLFWPNNFIHYQSQCCATSFERHRKSVYRCNPMATIKVLESPRHNVTSNPCYKDNGGCQHMCILTSKAGTGYINRCACNVGWVLAENLRSCILAEDVLTYAQSTIIRSHLAGPWNGTFCEPYLPIVQGRSRLTDFDYHFKDNYLYYIGKDDISHDVIYRVHPNESQSEIFLLGEGENYQSLAIDWRTSSLYYANWEKGAINVVAANGTNHLSVLADNLQEPEALTYHPRGFIYFFQTNRSTELIFFTRIRTDGLDLTVFKNVRLRQPCGFAIDFNEDRVYWFEGSKSHIEHSNLDLNDVQIVRSALTKSLYAISVHEKWIYLVTTNSEGLWRADKKTGKEPQLILPDLGNRITRVKVFSPKIARGNNDNGQIIHSNTRVEY